MTDVQILSHLKTEASDERSANLSELAPLEFARLMNDFNREAVSAVESALPQIARAIEGIAARLKAGGRLFYLGAGTSGRLGVLDASECPPTFGVDADLVVGIMAGGDGALRNAAEGAEDDGPAAVRDLQARDLRAADAVVAISASGYAPYCRAALDYAREVGALAIALSCNENAPQSAHADIAIEAPTGAEILSGSTRLKAGTATKLILNMLSTGAMVQMGKVYKNLMVDVRATNAKLRDRSVRIVMQATGLKRAAAQALLEEAGGIKTAIVMHEARCPREAAQRALEAADGFVARAIEVVARS